MALDLNGARKRLSDFSDPDPALWWEWGAKDAEALRVLLDAVSAREADNRRLREALEPFVALWRDDPRSDAQALPGDVVIARLSDCQRAEEVLK